MAAPSGGPGAVVAPRKVVKKKRGKRVGVASSSSSGGAEGGAADLPDPYDAEGVPDSTRDDGTGDDGARAAPQSRAGAWSVADALPAGYPSTPTPQHDHPAPVAAVEESPPMRIKAERAMDKAEEFIREKQMRQRTAISSAAERAMQQRGGPGGEVGGPGSGSGSAWKTANDAAAPPPPASLLSSSAAFPPPSPSNSGDETYRAARAAAEEARRLADDRATSHSKGKPSLFGSFFHRKVGAGGGSANHEIASYSTHGGVIGPGHPPSLPAGWDVLRRGESGGSSSSGGGGGGGGGFAPPPPPSGGTPGGNDDGLVDVDAAVCEIEEEERRKREFESELERQRRTDLERRQLADRRRAEEERSAAAARLNLEAERLRRVEEEERAERQRLEAERRRAPREKVRTALDRLAASARAATDDVSRLREAKAALVEALHQSLTAERYAAQRAKFAEAQQAVAVEEEDFESADRLGDVIAMHSREREEQSAVRQGIQTAIVELDLEREAAAGAVAASFGEARVRLAELRNEVDDRSREEEMQSQLASTSKRLSSESERLANDSKNIERDEKVLAEEQKELDEQIGEEAKEFEEKCKEARCVIDAVSSISVSHHFCCFSLPSHATTASRDNRTAQS